MAQNNIKAGFGIPPFGHGWGFNTGGYNLSLNDPDMNNDTFYGYLTEIMQLYMSAITWQGLPKGVSARQLEYWLMTNGVVALVKDDTLKDISSDAPEGYAVLQVMLTGSFDIYDLPDTRNAYSVVSAVNGMELTKDNSILIWDTLLRAPTYQKLVLFAKRLANCDRTIDINVANQKTTKIIRTTKKQALSLKNALNQQQDNQIVRWEDSSTTGDDTTVEYDATAPYVASDIQLLKRQIWSELLTYCGIKNNYGDKRERLITSEVEQGAGDVIAHKNYRLKPRQDAADLANEIWNLNIEVGFAADDYEHEQQEEDQIALAAGKIMENKK